jgi:tellurite resistance protein
MSNEIKVPADVKYAHVLTLLYLFIAGYSDGEFSDSEMAIIKLKISNWMGDDATNADVNGLILEACAWYDSLNEDGLKNTVVNSLPILKKKFNDDLLKIIISDLIAVAEADGKVTKSEFGNVKVITEALGFSL